MYNPGNKTTPAVDFDYDPAERILPRRYRALQDDGVLHNGYLDVAIIPCILGLTSDYVWVVEYDVDYSGDWGDLFSMLNKVEGDLLTSLVQRRADQPDWYHWQNAKPPPGVDTAFLHSSFNPFMRLSRDFAEIYREHTNEAEWNGHYEYILPTIAAVSSSRVVDIGGQGEFTPAELRGKTYDPETYRWRPFKSKYFHEDPGSFADRPNHLHHPVKPDVPIWDVEY